MSDAVPTALYRLFGDGDLLLYIGISDTFGRRWNQHAQSQSWWPEVRRQSVDWYQSRPEAETAEEAAIKAEGPRHNIMHNPAHVPSVPQGRTPREVFRQRERDPRQVSDHDIKQMFLLAAMGGLPVEAIPGMPGGAPGASGAIDADFFAWGAKGVRFIDDMLATAWLLEGHELAAETLAEARKAVRLMLRPTGLKCPYCGDAPSEAMTCRGCGADGPLPGRPRSVMGQVPYPVRVIAAMQPPRSRLRATAHVGETAA